MKKLFAILMALMLLVLAVACQKEEDVTLKVAAMKGPTGMGLAYVMQEHAEEFSVELYDAPDAVTAKFISGEIDVAAVPINLASVLYNKTEGDAVMIAVNTLGVLYLVENGNTVSSLEDLAGKTVYATGQGSTPEYVLNGLLAAKGLTDSVTVEFVGEHATLAAMAASGEVALAMLPEPNVTSVLLKNADARVALELAKEWESVNGVSLVQGCYVARRAVVEQYPKAVQAFVTACKASVAKVNGDADAAAAVIASYGIVPAEAVAKAAIPRCNIVCVTGEEMRSAASATLSALYNANPKSIGGKLPDDALYAK